jgi:hypothetical protein
MSVGLASVCKMPVGDMSVNQMSVGKMHIWQISVNKDICQPDEFQKMCLLNVCCPNVSLSNYQFNVC